MLLTGKRVRTSSTKVRLEFIINSYSKGAKGLAVFYLFLYSMHASTDGKCLYFTAHSVMTYQHVCLC